MDYRPVKHRLLLRAFFLAFVSQVGFIGGQATASTAQCVGWVNVYDCPCIAALDEDGHALPNKAVVDCSSRDLTEVPTPRQQNGNIVLYELRLSNNSITTLPRNAFKGIKIRHVNLTGNSIATVNDEAFLNTDIQMEALTIEGNLNAPPMDAIRTLLNLEELTMTNYKLKEVGENYFISFRSLRSLTLDNWGIETIHYHAFLHVDGIRTMRSLTLINQNLIGLPVDIFFEDELHHLDKLHISHTKITKITKFVFQQLDRAKEIILSNNKISEIQDDSFNGVGKTLEKVDLSNNLLGENELKNMQALSGLSQLKQLILHGNGLSSMPKIDNIGDGQSLFHLDLSKNVIETILNDDLSKYKHRLKGLDLTENKILTIGSQAFLGTTSLETLVVKLQLSEGDSNTDLVLPSSLEQSANSLTYLDVSGQDVDPTSLWELLTKFKKLKTLIIHSVGLTSIPDFAFQKLTRLTTLDLGFNGITRVSDKTFVGPRNLETLTLGFNALTRLPPCLFYNYDVTRPLSLDMNSISFPCDCSVKTLLENYKNGFISFPEDDSIPKCREDGKPFTSKDPALLQQCSSDQCDDYYVTTPSTDPQTTEIGPTTPEPTVSIVGARDIGVTSMVIAWRATNLVGFREYKVTANANTGQAVKEHVISVMDTQEQEIIDLTANTHYNVCVFVYFTENDRLPISDCTTLRTIKDPNDPNAGGQGGNEDDSGSANVGIIVGCVVGVLALLAVITAVVYLLVVRRRPKKLEGGGAMPPKMMGPVQPRAFAKSELPSMNGDSRSFVKAKKMNGAGKATEGMQVVAISDGQTGGGSGRGGGGMRVGRAERLSPDGTYAPMDRRNKGWTREGGYENKGMTRESDYESMDKSYESMGGKVNSAYENDHGSLPPTPNKPKLSSSSYSPPPTPDRGGYVNEAFSKYEEVTV